MATMHIQDIAHKKIVPNKYMPNSYRIFCEEVDHQSVPSKYSNQAPKLYTDPMIVPAQAIEDRNNPHAGRGAEFLRENARTLNEPVNRINSRNVSKDMEKRWWEWTLPEEDSNWKHKKRSTSMSAPKEHSVNNHHNDTRSGFQTTYQKEHGYIKDVSHPNSKIGSVNENFGSAQRHTFNPTGSHAVGIVPINDLNSLSKQNEQQRVFVDRVSFEQAYDSRNDKNYPMRGRRHGAFVVEQVEPKQSLGLKVRPDPNKNTSVWDCMHPDKEVIGNPPPKAQIYVKPSSGKPESAGIRRDPIGYFEDTKYSELSNGNGYEHHQNGNSNPPYKPSWSNGHQNGNGYPHIERDSTANDLLENAMRPIAANGYRN